MNLVGLRAVKTPEEMQLIRRAVAISDEAFLQLLPHIRAGRKESELAAELEYNMRKLGSTKPSFETICASGKRSALPHGVASDKVVEEGDFITFDFGATYGATAPTSPGRWWWGRPLPGRRKSMTSFSRPTCWAKRP